MKAIPLLTLCLAAVLILWTPHTGGGTVLSSSQDEFSDDAHRPVLLVPGWLGRSRQMNALRERFLRDGWTEDDVHALDFVDPVGSNRAHAVELEEAIHSLLGRTGAEEVDVVVHSMGGLALWALLQEKGERLPIRRVVFLGSPLQGTFTAYLAWGDGGEEMRPESPFLEELFQGPPPTEWVDALTIRTPLDLNVVPGSGGTLPGVWDVIVCCPTHRGLMDDERTYEIARDFLLTGQRPDPETADADSGLSGLMLRSRSSGPGRGLSGIHP